MGGRQWADVNYPENNMIDGHGGHLTEKTASFVIPVIVFIWDQINLHNFGSHYLIPGLLDMLSVKMIARHKI